VRKINTLLNSSDKTSITEQKDFEKSFLIKADLVVDSIRLFARLIILELRNVFPGSGRPRTPRSADKIEEVETLVLSQEDLPQTHRRPTQRQIAREVGISQRSVNRIVKKDLRLIGLCMKKRRAHELAVAMQQTSST